MSQIKPGDMVMMVWGCCSITRGDIGWTGPVREIVNVRDYFCVPCCCGFKFEGTGAVIMADDIIVPFSWLRKIPGESVPTEKRETVEA